MHHMNTSAHLIDQTIIELTNSQILSKKMSWRMKMSASGTRRRWKWPAHAREALLVLGKLLD